MARIYKRTDRIPVKIDDITFKIAPLSVDQKTEIQQALIAARKGDYSKGVESVRLSMKYAIKSVEGLEDSEGKPYQVQLENGLLTDESIDDLWNVGVTVKLIAVCRHLLEGIPQEFKDESGNKLEGVEIVKETPSVPNV